MSRDTDFPPAVLAVVHGRSDWWCEMCGLARAIEHHHRRARGMGGTLRDSTSSAANCLHTCRECHRLVESNRNLAKVLGWLVEQHSDPAQTPVVYRGGRVLLDELGNMRAAA
jgi:hypothetical protein